MNGRLTGKTGHLRQLAAKTTVIVSVSLGLVGLALLVVFARDVLLLVFAGVLLAVFLHGLASLARQRIGFAYGWALASVLLVLLTLASAIGYLLAPSIIHQSQQLADELPRAFERLRADAEGIDWVQRTIDKLPSTERLVGRRGDILSRITGFVSNVFGLIANAVVIAFVGLYLAVSPAIYCRGALALAPPKHRLRAREVMGEVADTLWWWLLAKLASMSIVGVLTVAGLWVLEIPMAGALAFIAALLAFIPNVGPIFAAVPAVLLGLSRSPKDALYVIALYMAIQFVESYLITPVMQKKAINLPPALILSAQVLLGVAAGGLGLLLATPLCASVVVLVRELYVKQWSGDGASDDLCN